MRQQRRQAVGVVSDDADEHRCTTYRGVGQRYSRTTWWFKFKGDFKLRLRTALLICLSLNTPAAPELSDLRTYRTSAAVLGYSRTSVIPATDIFRADQTGLTPKTLEGKSLKRGILLYPCIVGPVGPVGPVRQFPRGFSRYEGLLSVSLLITDYSSGRRTCISPRPYCQVRLLSRAYLPSPKSFIV